MTKESRDIDRELMPMIGGVEVQPVFIMGDHRTGTTILNKILAATECFNPVTVYHVINFKNLLHNYINQTVEEEKKKLSGRFAQMGVNQRGIDTISVSPETPEEYAFILHNAGYRPQLNPHNLLDLITLCQKIVVTGFAEKPVLLKNPWDFLNFMYVKEAFPDSRLIFIHRHPVRTINSQLKATRSIFSRRNEYIAMVVGWYDRLFHQPLRRRLFELMYSSLLESGLRITTRHNCRAISYFLSNISKLPPSDYINIRYEDLCAAPGHVIDEILNWLQISSPVQVQYESFISKRSVPLLPEVRRRLGRICQKTRSYLDYFGYDCDGAL